MKKMFFAVFAAFVMSFGLMSCSSSPEERLVSLAEEALEVMKGTHIESEADADALREKMEKLNDEVKEINKTGRELYDGLSDEEAKARREKYKDLEKEFKKLEKEAEKESERLRSEAREHDIDISDIRM